MCPSCGKVFFRSEDLARTVTTCPACAARVTFNKEGKVALIKQVKYAREDPKHVRTYFNELKQHKVSFRTRMQWLSRIYGGRGGYTSEELYKIVTGKTVGGYYIFPFVKGAPPEVNRILERTYRTHREAGDTKVAAAIAAWTKVKQAGYIKEMKPAPVWTKRSYAMNQLKPMQVVNYGIGTSIGGLAERGARGLFGVVRRHPKSVGAFGVGYLTRKELVKRRKRKKGYQLGLEHLTPDIPLNRMERLGKRFPTRKGITGVGKRIGGTASMAVKAAIVGLAATHLLHALAKRQPRAPWLPEIRPDIELSGPGYETLDQVVQYASAMPNKLLQVLKSKTGAALHETSPGVKRGLLMWLLGYISAALLDREQTTPAHQHAASFPDKHQLFARLHTKGGVEIPGGVSAPERLPRWGYQPFKPTKTKLEPLPKFKRPHRLRRIAKGTGVAATLPLAALLAIRLSKRGQEGYAFGPAAMKVGRGLKWGFKHPKVTKLLGKKAPLPARAGSFVRRRPGTVAGVAGGTLALRELRKIRKQRKQEGYSFRSVAKKVARPGVIAGLTLGVLATHTAIRKRRRRQRWAELRKAGLLKEEQNYSFRSAASKTLRGLKKVGRGAGKVGKGVGWAGGKAYPVAITAMIASEFWPKKKHQVGSRPMQPPVRSQPYGLAKGLKQLLKLRKGKASPVLGRKLRDLTLSRKDPALADLNKRLAAAAQKMKKFQIVEMYPMRSKAQRRWMHWKKPKMAKEWEEHTPEGKELPEHVSKHALPILVQRAVARRVGPELAKTIRIARLRQKWNRTLLANAAIAAGTIGLATSVGLKGRREKEKVSKHFLGVPVITPLVLAAIIAKKRKEAQAKVKPYTLQAPLLWRHIRSVKRLRGARILGRDITRWGSEMAARMRTLAASTPGQRITIKGVSTPAPAWFGKEAAKWDAVAGQAKDMVIKGQLEKVGLLAAGTAAAAAAHEVGKKRERARVRKVVG